MTAPDLETELKTWRMLFGMAQREGLVAKNIEISENGREIVLKKQDPSKPVALSIPPHLLIPLDTIDFENRRIRPSETDTQEVLAFKEAVLTTILNERRAAPFRALAEDMKVVDQRLQENKLPRFLPKLSELSADRVSIDRKVISARAIGRLADYPSSIMPILDLANHLPGGLAFQRAKSNGAVFISGPTLGDEVSLRYGFYDPLMLADDYGFSDAAPWAYSLAIALRASDRMQVSIYRNPASSFIPGRTVPAFLPVKDDQTRAEAGTTAYSLDCLPLNVGLGINVTKDQLTEAHIDVMGPSAPQFFDAVLRANLDILDTAETLTVAVEPGNSARGLLIKAIEHQRRAIYAFS